MMEYHKPIIGNFFLNHPILSGIKLMLVFVWIPAFNDMNWDTYLHFYLPFIVPLLYGLEIISFVLTLFGRGDLVDNTMGFSDAVWVYGVTTENGKNSTLSDLVFVKVIDN